MGSHSQLLRGTDGASGVDPPQTKKVQRGNRHAGETESLGGRALL